MYIVSTYIIVVFGALITFLATFSDASLPEPFEFFTAKGFLIALSLTITVLTGINASFQYQQTWHGRMSALLRIEFLI